MSMSLGRINRAASSVYGGMMRNEDKQERKLSATANLARARDAQTTKLREMLEIN